MKLCYATFDLILRHCRKPILNFKSHEFSIEILSSVDRDYFEAKTREKKSTREYITRLRSCEVGLKSDFINKAMSMLSDPYVVSSFFKERIIHRLDDTKHKLIILAIRDIISKDSSISNDIKVDLLKQKTKYDIIKQKDFVFTEFLAGIFLFCITQVKNTEGEATIGNKSITNKYISDFEDKTGSINLIENELTNNKTNIPSKIDRRIINEKQPECEVKSTVDLLTIYKEQVEETYAGVKLLHFVAGYKEEAIIPIQEIYVDLRYEPFRFAKIVVSNDKIGYRKSCEELVCTYKEERRRRENMNMVILGLPGSGKSTLLKYLLYRYNQDKNIVPIYIELKGDKSFKS
jgi:hypothetical protein